VDQQTTYQIRISGHLEERWQAWFDGMEITNLENGETLFTGPLPDQAALFGVLIKVRDLGLPLLAVNRLQVEQDTETPSS
jgi:hypothetical protein